MMTTTEQTKAIRQALKTAGVAARAVSVRADGSSIRVRINSASVKKALVAGIAMQYESISRDERSGEILCGGNTFVSVDYTAEALAELVASVKPALDAMPDDGTNVEIGHGLVAFAGDRYYVYVMNGDEQIVHCWGREFAARQVAEWLANRETAEKAAA